MDLYLIDAIGPFFVGYKKRVINWSKIPFENLEKEDQLDNKKIAAIIPAFEQFLKSVKAIGYNGITIDDVAHLVDLEVYPEEYSKKIRQYQDLYKKVIDLALENDLKVFFNTDIMFFNQHIRNEVGRDRLKTMDLLQQAVSQALSQFSIDGIIFRIGETDGEDVTGDFKSKMIVKTPKQANQLIKDLLPVFEEHNKHLIFRNWTVGCYAIGDLMWNPKSFNKTFAGINSPNLIISMKFGDTDFFSCLELNPLIFQCNHKILLELQTRRERECFGVFPYYVGWEYEAYYNRLKALNNLVGITVWSQTGGWSRNRNLTWVEDSSVWNELNTTATIQIFKDGISAEKAIRLFFQDERYVEFLKLFYDVFRRLLYIEDFANKQLYFRRTRIPPLLWFSWDYITVNPVMTAVYQIFSNKIYGFNEAKIDRIYQLGEELKIENMEYCYDTLRLLSQCRKTLLGQYEAFRLLEYIGLFRRKHRHCNIKFFVKKGNEHVFWVRLLLRIFTRQRAKYRLVDRIFLNRIFALTVFKVILLLVKGRMPKFTNKHAMKLELLFK
ncbi:MAG: hypothetical protein MJE63_30325 [Proteobacteria bacterium]|nr:hypothetical protein [Pseudomonadota bacterium]